MVGVLRVLGSAGGELQPVLESVAESAARLSKGNAFLWMADADGAMRVQAAYGSGTDEQLDYERTHPHLDDDPKTLTGRVVRSRDTVCIPDILEDPDYEWSGQGVGTGYRALLGVPIIAERELLGMLGISWVEPQVFTDDQVRLVSTFADQAAIAITNARLFAAIDRQREELSRFLSPQVADLVSSERGRQLLAGHRAHVTVLFSDLRGFTSFAETAEPEELFDVLREYHREIGELIDQFGGTLEHFAGDGVMVFFNDPVPLGITRPRQPAWRSRCGNASKRWRWAGASAASSSRSASASPPATRPWAGSDSRAASTTPRSALSRSSPRG